MPTGPIRDITDDEIRVEAWLVPQQLLVLDRGERRHRDAPLVGVARAAADRRVARGYLQTD